MIAYHFSFDLAYYGRLHADFNHDPFWLTARAAIVSMFLALVGFSLALSAVQHRGMRHFVSRQFRIGLCAAAVSAGSYVMFPRSFIFFGILHFIFVASLIGAALLRGRLPAAVIAGLGVLALGLGLQVSAPIFDAAPLQWIGFMTHKPTTEDYVPLFPWIGVVLLGIAVASWLPAAWKTPRVGPPLKGVGGPGRIEAGCAWMGRHSLLIYMLHQPLMLGVLYLMFGH
jgi:uncharacterized membrane protein